MFSIMPLDKKSFYARTMHTPDSPERAAHRAALREVSKAPAPAASRADRRRERGLRLRRRSDREAGPAPSAPHRRSVLRLAEAGDIAHRRHRRDGAHRLRGVGHRRRRRPSRPAFRAESGPGVRRAVRPDAPTQRRRCHESCRDSQSVGASAWLSSCRDLPHVRLRVVGFVAHTDEGGSFEEHHLRVSRPGHRCVYAGEHRKHRYRRRRRRRRRAHRPPPQPQPRPAFHRRHHRLLPQHRRTGP